MTMKRLFVTMAAAAAAAMSAGAAHAQIDGGKAFVSPLPFFKDMPAWDPGYKAPRTPDGHPDLQGLWSSASLTMLERGVSYGGGIKIDTLVIPSDKVDAYVADSYYAKQYKEQAYTDPSVGAGDGKGGGDVRGYNAFWIDPGAEYGKVNTEYRSSWITSPASGRVPYSKAGREARQARIKQFRSVGNTGPEARSIGDRCLISYTGQAGPPMQNGMYNNHYQIVQTPKSIMIDTEMNHDARIIDFDAKPRPDAIKQWFGDSQAHWEGETLVVVTHNLHPIQASGGAVPLSEKGKVTERFTRKSKDVILYEFTVEDPVFYSETWKGEMPLRLSTAHMYEYACHEGNYALPGMLRGDAMGADTAIEKNGE
jgi:hypothetical protein